MSLVIRRIAIENFRKFRDPFTIDNLTDGLNIIIEPNETGKSTLMEALRAAFFVRHNTQNQLAKSYAPRGDSVAPRVEVDFLIDGAEWSLRKRFLKSASIDVEGPQGRAQGDEAEAVLNTLLGSVRDTSRAGDVSTYGALGLLWVAQMDALDVIISQYQAYRTISNFKYAVYLAAASFLDAQWRVQRGGIDLQVGGGSDGWLAVTTLQREVALVQLDGVHAELGLPPFREADLQLAGRPGVGMVVADQCQYGLTTPAAGGPAAVGSVFSRLGRGPRFSPLRRRS